jgi:hypothetical protein
MHCKLFPKLGVRTPSPSSPSCTSLVQDYSLCSAAKQCPRDSKIMLFFLNSQSIGQFPNGFQILLSQKFQCTPELLTGFQKLLLDYFKSQFIGSLPNGFQISCSIGQLPNGLERTQNSQSQIESVGHYVVLPCSTEFSAA